MMRIFSATPIQRRQRRRRSTRYTRYKKSTRSAHCSQTEIVNYLFFFLLLHRNSAGSGDPPAGIPNRQVSLANIATAFLSERKSSSRRQSSTRRKKRLGTKGGSGSSASRHSSYATTADDILSQRFSAEEIPCGIATILVSTTNNADSKHRTTAVSNE